MKSQSSSVRPPGSPLTAQAPAGSASDASREKRPAETLSAQFSAAAILRTRGTLLALLFLVCVLALVTNGEFLDPRNFTNLTRQIGVIGVLSVGMTLVILTSGIDLSIGSVVALTGVVAGMVQVHAGMDQYGAYGTAVTILAAVAVGLGCGMVNGGLIAFFRIPPFVITLGMMVIARGLALIISGSSAISPMSDSTKFVASGFLPFFASGPLAAVIVFLWLRSVKRRVVDVSAHWSKAGAAILILTEAVCLGYPLWCFAADRGLPIPALILLLTAGIGAFFLQSVPMGRYVYAIGANEEAARLAGINVARVKLVIYAVMGALAGIGGVMLAARLNSATPTEGTLFELDAIAAVVIGGTSLMGGVGTVVGSVVGALFIGTLNNGMDLLGIDSNYQMVVKGIIIIVAVWSDVKNKASLRA